MNQKYKVEDTDPFSLEFNKSDVVNINDEDSDPFGNIFGAEDVVNKKQEKPQKQQPKSLDYKISSEEGGFRRQTSGKQKITEDDLEKILSTEEGSRLQRNFQDQLQKSDHKGLLTKDDIDNIIATDEGDRRKRVFNTEYIGEENPRESNEMRLQKHYMDFLNFPKITGAKSGIPHSNLLPAEFLTPRQKKIDIVDEPNIEHKHDRHSSVVVNRDENGELESIEFFCKCGERTYLKFDYVDSPLERSLTEVITAEEADDEHHEDIFGDPISHRTKATEDVSELSEATDAYQETGITKKSEPATNDPFTNPDDFKDMSEDEIEKLMMGHFGISG